MTTVKIPLIAEIEVPPGRTAHGSRSDASRILDEFRETTLPKANWGITLYQPGVADVPNPALVLLGDVFRLLDHLGDWDKYFGPEAERLSQIHEAYKDLRLAEQDAAVKEWKAAKPKPPTIGDIVQLRDVPVDAVVCFAPDKTKLLVCGLNEEQGTVGLMYADGETRWLREARTVVYLGQGRRAGDKIELQLAPGVAVPLAQIPVNGVYSPVGVLSHRRHMVKSRRPDGSLIVVNPGGKDGQRDAETVQRREVIYRGQGRVEGEKIVLDRPPEPEKLKEDVRPLAELSDDDVFTLRGKTTKFILVYLPGDGEFVVADREAGKGVGPESFRFLTSRLVNYLGRGRMRTDGTIEVLEAPTPDGGPTSDRPPEPAGDPETKPGDIVPAGQLEEGDVFQAPERQPGQDLQVVGKVSQNLVHYFMDGQQPNEMTAMSKQELVRYLGTGFYDTSMLRVVLRKEPESVPDLVTSFSIAKPGDLIRVGLLPRRALFSIKDDAENRRFVVVRPTDPADPNDVEWAPAASPHETSPQARLTPATLVVYQGMLEEKLPLPGDRVQLCDLPEGAVFWRFTDIQRRRFMAGGDLVRASRLVYLDGETDVASMPRDEHVSYLGQGRQEADGKIVLDSERAPTAEPAKGWPVTSPIAGTGVVQEDKPKPPLRSGDRAHLRELKAGDVFLLLTDPGRRRIVIEPDGAEGWISVSIEGVRHGSALPEDAEVQYLGTGRRSGSRIELDLPEDEAPVTRPPASPTQATRRAMIDTAARAGIPHGEFRKLKDVPKHGVCIHRHEKALMDVVNGEAGYVVVIRDGGRCQEISGQFLEEDVLYLGQGKLVDGQIMFEDTQTRPATQPGAVDVDQLKALLSEEGIKCFLLARTPLPRLASEALLVAVLVEYARAISKAVRLDDAKPTETSDGR